MFHHFPGEEGVGQDCLVRSTDFVYRDIRNNPEDVKKGHPIASFIASVSQNGYKRQAAGGYLKKSLPPLEFEYSQAIIHEDVQEIDAESLENLPYGVDGSNYQWVDLDGEGISGILTEQANGWFYKRNLSPTRLVQDNGTDRIAARFGPVELVASNPSTALAAGQASSWISPATARWMLCNSKVLCADSTSALTKPAGSRSAHSSPGQISTLAIRISSSSTSTAMVTPTS